MTFDFNKVDFEDVPCLFCGPGVAKEKLFSAPDRINKTPGEFSLVRCTQCRLVFQSPRPKEEFIKHYYPDETPYYTPADSKSHASTRLGRFKRFLSGVVLANYFGYGHLGPRQPLLKLAALPLYLWMYRDQTIPLYKEGGKLLEIGCAYGYRLEKDARRGWQVFGIEMNESAGRIAREKKGLNIKTGSILDADFPDASFDVVVLDMVLEHLYNPAQVLERAGRWLRPGGELLFSIPYFESAVFSMFGEHTYDNHLPAHLYFFNKDHIKRMLKSFEGVKFVFQHFDRSVVVSAQYKYKETGKWFYRLPASNKIFRNFFVKPMMFALAVGHGSSRLTVRAVKGSKDVRVA